MSANSYLLFSKRLQRGALYNVKHSSIPKGTLEWFESRQQSQSHPNTSPSPTATLTAVPPGLKKLERVQKQENDPYEDELLRIPSYDLFLYQDINYILNELLFNYKNLLEYVDKVAYSTPLFIADN